MVDIQGAETVLLERARDLLTAGRVRFMIVSTHHQSISGDPLTHQRALRLLQECGAHIIAEHTVRESYSGDGLIAVGFDPADADLVVPISHARAADSLFGEPEQELAALTEQVKQQAAQLAASQHAEAALRAELEELRAAVTAGAAQPTTQAPADPESAHPESAHPESAHPEPGATDPEPTQQPKKSLAQLISQRLRRSG